MNLRQLTWWQSLCLIVCLSASLGIGLWLSDSDTPVLVTPVIRSTDRAHATDTNSHQEGAINSALPPVSSDLFAIRSWAPPPAPPSPPVAPPPPQAPPLPFTFMGRIAEAHEMKFMLVRNDQVITVKSGDDIDEQYQLVKADESQLVFFYRPMNQRQTLTVGTPPWTTP